MKLAKCANGHFYDADKFPECPYCNAALQKDASIVEPAAAAAAPVDRAQPEGPVTGWLVAMDGAAQGRDLRLGVGRSFIGVDTDAMPVLLSADAPLSGRQAVVVYDPEESAFTLLPGSSQELCYLAGKAVLTPQPLKAGAEITVGGTRLRFVPFCGEFRWEKPGAEHKKQPEKPAKPEAKPAKDAPAAKAGKPQAEDKTEKTGGQPKKPAAK